MYCSMPFFVLEQVLNQAEQQPTASQSCRANASAKSRGFCGGRYPYAQHSSPRSRTPSPPRGVMEVRELSDSYVLFVDIPGFSRNDVHVSVEGDTLFISAAGKSNDEDCHSAGSSKDIVVERPRGRVKRSWRLPKDAMLDGIHAKVHNGELTIIVPKRKAFSVPVLGADGEPAALPEPAQEPAPKLATPPAESEPALTTPSEPAHVAEQSPAKSPAAAEQPADDSPAEKVPDQDDAMAEAEESDGSWEDLSDEEREADEAARKAKGKLPLEGPVLEEVERHEAEMCAQQHDSDSG